MTLIKQKISRHPDLDYYRAGKFHVLVGQAKVQHSDTPGPWLLAINHERRYPFFPECKLIIDQLIPENIIMSMAFQAKSKAILNKNTITFQQVGTASKILSPQSGGILWKP